VQEKAGPVTRGLLFCQTERLTPEGQARFMKLLQSRWIEPPKIEDDSERRDHRDGGAACARRV
jgi:hypothetical protein